MVVSLMWLLWLCGVVEDAFSGVSPSMSWKGKHGSRRRGPLMIGWNGAHSTYPAPAPPERSASEFWGTLRAPEVMRLWRPG